MLGWGFSGLLLRSQLGSFSIGVPSLRLEKDERLILGQVCIYSWKRRALCFAVLGCVRNLWLNTLWGLFWETKYGRFTTLNIAKCEHFTLLVRPLQFLVISALGRLGNVQGFTLMIILDPSSKTWWFWCPKLDACLCWATADQLYHLWQCVPWVKLWKKEHASFTAFTICYLKIYQ